MPHSSDTFTSRPVQHAECDVSLTRDGHLVLCHDGDFSRLALDPTSTGAKTPVHELDQRGLAGIPLRSGCTPPRLSDVLSACVAVGDPARLVIEIKPGGSDAVSALERLLAESPHLRGAVSVVMSFDLEIARASAAMVTRGYAKAPSRPAVMYLRDTEGYCGPPLSLSTLDDGVVEEYVSGATAKTRRVGSKATGAAKAVPAGQLPLDGLYIRFEPSMLVDGPEAERFKALCSRCVVGVWGARVDGKHDTLDTARRLVALGATFVNTDLPLTYVPSLHTSL